MLDEILNWNDGTLLYWYDIDRESNSGYGIIFNWDFGIVIYSEVSSDVAGDVKCFDNK